MTKVLAILAVSLLTGCGTTVNYLAAAYDSADACQRKPYPSYCGASSGRTTIYATPNGMPVGKPLGYTKKSQ